MASDSNRIPPPFSPPDCPWVVMDSGSTIPENAVDFGDKLKGVPVYIGRVYDDNCYLNGTVMSSTGNCIFLSKNGEKKSTASYDILTVSSFNPLEFQSMALDGRNRFVSGGDLDNCVYCARVVDGENTYIGWADPDTKTVYIPRDPKDGPGKLKDNYEILIHTFLDRMCTGCPVPPRS